MKRPGSSTGTTLKRMRSSRPVPPERKKEYPPAFYVTIPPHRREPRQFDHERGVSGRMVEGLRPVRA